MIVTMAEKNKYPQAVPVNQLKHKSEREHLRVKIFCCMCVTCYCHHRYPEEDLCKALEHTYHKYLRSLTYWGNGKQQEVQNSSYLMLSTWKTKKWSKFCMNSLEHNSHCGRGAIRPCRATGHQCYVPQRLKSTSASAVLLGYKSQLCRLQGVLPWTSYLTFCAFSFRSVKRDSGHTISQGTMPSPQNIIWHIIIPCASSQMDVYT